MTAAHDLFPGVVSVAKEKPDDRYTTTPTMHLVKQFVGVKVFDLDPAACEESHKAVAYFTVEDNGLEQPWFGWVFCNPPFSDLESWVKKAWGEIHRCAGIAMIMPANRAEQGFWQELIEPFRDGRGEPGEPTLTTHYLPTRISYGCPGNPEGIGAGSPPFGTVLLVWRPA
jgi:hypothetical protein